MDSINRRVLRRDVIKFSRSVEFSIADAERRACRKSL